MHGLATLILPLLAALQTQVALTTDFAALRDSLSRLRDPVVVRRLETERAPVARASAEGLLQNGWIALRLYDLTRDPADSKRAVRAFEQAVHLQPANTWAQYGLGLSLAGSPEARWLGEGGTKGRFVLDDAIRKVTGEDPRSRARRAFVAALSGERPIEPAARELARLALVTWRREDLVEAKNALQKLVDANLVTAEDWLVLAEVQSAIGDYQAAAARADSALAHGSPNGTMLRVAALTRLRGVKQEKEGARFYFEGIAASSAEELLQYWWDVALITNSGDRVEWEQRDVEGRRELLRRFWDKRAAAGGVTVPDRLAEHYRRLGYAEERFRRRREAGAPAMNNMRWNNPREWSRFDDRGEIYLRHGAPQRVVRTINPRAAQNETWVYLQPGPTPRVFHFLYMEGDYTLPWKLPCGNDYWDARSEFEPRGRLYMVDCDPVDNMTYSLETRREAFAALGSDSHYPVFLRDIPFLYDLYTFRGAGGKTTVVAAFAVPASALEKTQRNDSVVYRFDLTLILSDTVNRVVSRTDDTASIKLPRALDRDDMLRAHLEVQVAPLRTTLQRVIVTDPTSPGIGQLYGGPFLIPDYTGDHLMVSDIALGYPDPVRGWRRGEVALALVPTNNFKEGQFSLFYELYNLPRGTKYTTEVIIERVNKSAAAKIKDFFGGEGTVRFRFEGESIAGADNVMTELRRIEAPLGKGRFRLTVNVKNLSSGQTARTSRFFVIPD